MFRGTSTSGSQERRFSVGTLPELATSAHCILIVKQQMSISQLQCTVRKLLLSLEKSREKSVLNFLIDSIRADREDNSPH